MNTNIDGRAKMLRLVLDENDDPDDIDGDEFPDPSPITQAKHRRKSVVGAKKQRNASKPRRRRRSSARFLRLGPSNGADGGMGNNMNEDGVDDGFDDEFTEEADDDDLGAMYQKAIRMNAENRINATNSWNLSLIDHLDRFLSIPTSQNQTTMPTSGPNSSSSNDNNDMVNFTRASCTLDASVKIYSYRVDDVHLTSYKVLANLNRTETSKKGGSGSSEAGKNGSNDDINDIETENTRRQKGPGNEGGNTDTLEQNIANINLHKLDAAFDIDPLFHKMSKSFDEGGAKGLLLANLGVGTNGCNIVFDSTLDDLDDDGNSHKRHNEEAETLPEDEKAAGVEIGKVGNCTNEGRAMVDVSSLTAKLATLLAGQSVNSLPLVPQLASLRDEFAELESQGFVEQLKPSKRYASTTEEENEADRSIHLEAIERSRASQGTLAGLRSSFLTGGNSEEDEFSGFAADDFDSGGDDEPMDDGMLGAFMTDDDHRFSSISFRDSFEAAQPPSQATALLNAIASGDIVGSQVNQFDYFDKDALEAIQANNQWAGSAHWKKLQRRCKSKLKDQETGGNRQPKETPMPNKNKRKNKRSAKRGTSKGDFAHILVDITSDPFNLDDLLRRPPKPKGKRGAASNDPLQLAKSAISKHSKSDNLLPFDAGIELLQLSSLFSRPTSAIGNLVTERSSLVANPSSTVKAAKAVGFTDVEQWDNGCGDDYDDDHNGGGFCFGGEDDDDGGDDFVIQELEGVRRVEKVQVGYATVAKKVDVKRLKRDLWTEIETSFVERLNENTDPNEVEDPTEKKSDSRAGDRAEMVGTDFEMSFQSTVRDMQKTQSQADVTLPFYFICVLHLANEKNLELHSQGLEDFHIQYPINASAES